MAGEREKNKIDNKIIRDAKKILNENKSIDIFVIASRDGDYTELVKFLRSNRKRVVILAPKNTSKKLKNASSESRFIVNIPTQKMNTQNRSSNYLVFLLRFDYYTRL